jgi:hypothetical protein
MYLKAVKVIGCQYISFENLFIKYLNTTTMNHKKIILLLGMVMFTIGLVNAEDFKYVGAAKCKMCHNKAEKGEQYNKWANTSHAKAMDRLKGADASNPKCLKCHSTATSVDQSLVATITPAEGVSCESCHGPGSAYKVVTIMRNHAMSMSKGLIMPEEKVCRKCHNEESPTFKGFNYKEALTKVSHDDPTTK